MKCEKRTNKNGSFYYSFVHYDSKSESRLRLTKEEIHKRFGKDILTEAEAKACLPLLEAQYESEKNRIQRRLSWEKDFYNFTGTMEMYEKSQGKRARNSWNNSVFYMKHYVLPFFLTNKNLNNISLWPDYYEEFREWLESDAILLRSKKVISFSSKNHAIKSLNTFTTLCFEKKLVRTNTKCEAFADHLINKRTIDDVIFPKEMETLYSALKDSGHKVEAVFFRYLYFSGMRYSEGLAISLADLYQGSLPENQLLAKKIKIHGMKYFGDIVSDSQVEKGIRYPFKGKKEISERFARTIPVVDKVLSNDLVDLESEQFDLWTQLKGSTKKDFFLFQGMDDSTASRRLQEAFAKCKLKYRTWHCLRHSRATWLIGETGDEVLARAWLGHSSARIFDRYNHLYQALVREAKSRDTVGREFKLKKV